MKQKITMIGNSYIQHSIYTMAGKVLKMKIYEYINEHNNNKQKCNKHRHFAYARPLKRMLRTLFNVSVARPR
jgi:hypothetical protein